MTISSSENKFNYAMTFSSPVSLVQVRTTARLHMGFFDLNGGLGRRFGSIGVALEQPVTSLLARRAEGFYVEGVNAARALACAESFARKTGLTEGAAIQLTAAIPEHAGLGSGTQLALAVGVALARLYELPLTLHEIAALSGRGARSGVGVGAFLQGGLIVDGGRGADTVVPPVLARMAFPEQWRILLIFDHSGQGVHGSQEVEAFRQLPEFPAELAAGICRAVLMQALPAVAEHNLAEFGAAIHEIQCRIGDHFAAAQGGGRYTSPLVAGVLAWLQAHGIACVGQSSWGPTGFAVIENDAAAASILQQLAVEYAGQKNLSFVLSRARNQGSEVQVMGEAGAQPWPVK